MATSKSLKSSSTKAVAVKKPAGGSVVSLEAIKEQMARDLATLQGKTAPATGNVIRVTQDKQFILPDGTKTPGPLELVIVDFTTHNTFYEGAYDPKNITPPACFAIGDVITSMAPSDNSPDKQSEGCAGCPMNQFGSAGDGKACKNSRVMGVLPPDADADTPMWVLKTSPTANKGFDGYIGSVARQFGVPPYGVVTTVSFDSSKTYASLVFGNPTPNENLEVAYTRRDEARQLITTEPDVSAFEKAAPAKKPAVRRR